MKTFFVRLIIPLFVLGVLSCSEDDDVTVNSTPEFAEFESSISSLPGLRLIFSGSFNDPAGIRSVNIKYDDWFLDKTIIKDELPETYELAYQFLVPADAVEGSTHTVFVTVTNAGGVAVTREVIVTLDADVTAPSITVISPVDGGTFLISDNDEFQLEITVEDEELQSLDIASDLINEQVDLSGTDFTYSQSVNAETPGDYTISITCSDQSGNITTRNITVSILEELMFNRMYITDVSEESALTSDLFGIPATTIGSTVPDETGFVFTGKFYSPEPGTELRFVPQKTSFAPYTFGADPTSPGTLAFGDSPEVDGIVLPERGYYEVTMSLMDLTYTVTPYTPTDATFGQVYIIGKGVTTAGSNICTSNVDGSTLCWNFNSGKPFVADANNPNRWTMEATLVEQPNTGGGLGFILNANPNGWSPFWRFDANNDPEAIVPNGGTEFLFTTDDFGDYNFVLDTHLNRMTAVPR